MTLYISTTVGVGSDDLILRRDLLDRTLPDYTHKGMEIWFRNNNPEEAQKIKGRLAEILGEDYAEKYFLTVQARRMRPVRSDDMADPKNYYDITTKDGAENLFENAEAAKEIGARTLVAAPWLGIFRYRSGYKRAFDDPEYRSTLMKDAINVAKKVSERVRINVALETATVPLYGDINPNLEGAMFDLGTGLFEHSSQIPGNMLVLDTCHIESARNIVKRIGGDLSFVPGVMNAQTQPKVLEAIIEARPFEVHYAGFGGEWNPHSDPPKMHTEGCVPGGIEDVIGENTFIELTKHLKRRAINEDVVIVAEPNDESFMNPVNAEETLRKIYSWVKQ